MVNISMKAMLEAGVHFGHQTRRWNPKMARFIFGERNNIHIIDLQKTVKELKKATQWIKEVAAEGKVILMVGTKKQAQDVIKFEAERVGMPYVAEKWLGGMLTNYQTVRKSLQRLEELEQWEKDGVFRVLSKKEVSRLSKEMTKMRRTLTGVRTLTRLPDALFIIDPAEEDMAVSEARKLGIPITAICDTNCDPDLITHPVPGNDDAARSIKLFVNLMAEAIADGRAEYEAKQAKASVEGAEAAMQAAAVTDAEAQAAADALIAAETAEGDTSHVQGTERAAEAESQVS